MTTIDVAVYRQRRQRLLADIHDGVVVLATAPERIRNRDNHYPYRFDSYFYYLTGFTEPDAVLVMHGESGRSVLFCRPRDAEREIWDGFRYGPEAAQAGFGFDEAFPLAELDQQLPILLSNQRVLYCLIGDDLTWDQRVLGWLNTVRTQARSGVSAPTEIHDVRRLLDAMRVIKDEAEMATLQRSADIACVAHQRAMSVTRPGMAEYQIEAEILHTFRSRGAQAPAYTSIVAGGAHACVLHYIDNSAMLRDGELVLIDAGCELDGYASDITRTFPINGHFNGAQRDVYACVLAAQEAALAAVRPGASWLAAHEAAVRVLAQGMLDWGLLSGGVEGVIESGAYKRFYMHRTGHWLGLDVHDVGEYKQAGAWRRLELGMVLTVEPGCYIAAAQDVPEAFHGMGVRIEDDVCITADGCRVLTDAAPKKIADIEALMAMQQDSYHV